MAYGAKRGVYGGNQRSLKKRLGDANATTMDAFPVELVGQILSCVRRARDVAVASVTCRKWREAATNYIQKLSFDDSDWPKGKTSEAPWSLRDLIIVETVMRTACLKELSIHCDGKKSEIACALEYLEWHHAYIPRMNAFVNGFPSLVSLALETVVCELDARHFMLIISSFPRLKHLSLVNVYFIEAPSEIELNICTLETLQLDSISADVSTMLVVYDHKLGRLSLYISGRHSGHMHWKRGGSSASMQELRLTGMEVAEFKVEEGLGRLELDGGDIPELEIKKSLQHLLIDEAQIGQLKLAEKLDSLIELKLFNATDFENVWLSTYSQIVCKAGSRLCRLTIQGDLYKALINVDEVCSAFPYLQELSTNYPNFYVDESTLEPPCFEEMKNLNVNVAMLAENCVAFPKWITGLLQRCPNLRSVVIILHKAFVDEPVENEDFPCMLSFLMISIFSPYPHLNVTFEFP
ncbi:hypothetical protein GOP47_0020071 [Adiantum capillus-veneris]|uniref:F-box domain-containing protein n=1 Tax=Adiantum capillus-veneris TaxID=13818 RepID=A0A9D4UCA8_ADICA|nr:hypothetical protein GOP47_0020071 [Adiantum capillus-veneris]